MSTTSTATTPDVVGARGTPGVSSASAGTPGDGTPAFPALYRRIARRETHSSRSRLAIVLALALILVFAWIGTEIVLALLGAPALLVSPAALFAAAMAVPDASPGVLGTVGVVIALLGLLLVIAAIAPGRRPRHLLRTARTVTVVDDEVIASALARRAALVGGVAPDNATVTVSDRRAVVHLVPTSGLPVDRAAVAEDAASALDSYGLVRPVTARIVVAAKGRVGA